MLFASAVPVLCAFVKKGKRKNIKMGKWRKRINQCARIRVFNFFMIYFFHFQSRNQGLFICI